MTSIAAGTYGFAEFRGVLNAAWFSGMTVWKERDNELLEIGGEDRVDLREEMARLARESMVKVCGSNL